MLIDYLFETLKSGGWVMLPILFTGTLGFFMLGLVFTEFGTDFFRTRYDNFFESVFSRLRKNDTDGAFKIINSRSGIVSGSLKFALENRDLDESTLRNLLSEKLSKNLFAIDRHLPLITVMAAVAPLLGLLGTVTGMVHTFQVITEYGNSNPVLLAGGISEALITTQSGLIIAFPLVLFKHQLEGRLEWMKKQVELGITHFINHNYFAIENGARAGK